MIKYLGSKRLLLPRLLAIAEMLGDVRSVVDLFSGTARVGHAFKQAGYRVVANDITHYAHTLASCYVVADRERYEVRAREAIEKLNALEGVPGYFTETFCEQSRFFRPENGARIDAIRSAIESDYRDPLLRAVLITSLMEAADRVDSTTGVQMAYLKQWARRSYNRLELRLPNLVASVDSGSCEAHRRDAREAAATLSGDVAYLDPPYNQHKYYAYYHIWETLVRWDQPEHYGVACKREDCREHRSDFNSRPRIREALQDVIDNVDARYLVLSFNNEGFLSPEDLIEMLQRRGRVFRQEVDFRRYVGAQIGIHNRSGRAVGRVSHLKNRENIFVVLPPSDPRERMKGMKRIA